MLYHLLYPLHETYGFFNVFRYITFRTVIASLTALMLSFVFGPWLIRRLTARQIGQNIRPDGPESHLAKAGTPTMGGTLILFSLIFATLLLADLTNIYVWIVLAVTLGFGVRDHPVGHVHAAVAAVRVDIVY
jgi:phospho-N-acetylmuramoyl-pentapeptide-transferase